MIGFHQENYILFGTATILITDNITQVSNATLQETFLPEAEKLHVYHTTHQLQPWDNTGLVEEMFTWQLPQCVPNLEGILTHSTAIHI